jgi:hypothetical protein
MKHTIRIFILVLAVLPGCTTKPAIVEPAYEDFFLENITHVISWLDEAQFVEPGVGRANEAAFAFWKAYPDNSNVATIVREAMSFSSHILGETVDINLVVRAYIQAHSAYIENRTKEQGEILYKNLVDIISDIKSWEDQFPAWEQVLYDLDNAMQEHGFEYRDF